MEYFRMLFSVTLALYQLGETELLEPKGERVFGQWHVTEQSQEVRRPVHLRHGRVRVVREDLRILRPLEFVEQLSAQHHIEVLLYPGHHLVHSVLPDTHTDEKYVLVKQLTDEKWGFIQPI